MHHSMNLLFILLFFAFFRVQDGASLGDNTSCKAILYTNPNAPTGDYALTTSTGRTLSKVYCEMGLNGGGYTFLHPSDLPRLTNDELQALFTDNSSFLIRVRLSHGNQPYGVLEQLPEYRNVPLTLRLGNSDGFTAPVNVQYLGYDYLFYGFLHVSVLGRNYAGLNVNGKSIKFKQCEGDDNSYIALFPNINENKFSKVDFTLADNPVMQDYFAITAALLQNPSHRVMPEDYFIFFESHFGGCKEFLQFGEHACSHTWGTTEQTEGENVCFISASIGFR